MMTMDSPSTADKIMMSKRSFRSGPAAITSFAFGVGLCLAVLAGCGQEPSFAQATEVRQAGEAPAPAIAADQEEVASPGAGQGRAVIPAEQGPAEPETPAEETGPSVEGIAFEPSPPVTGDTLKATVEGNGLDREGVKVFYRWGVNDQTVQDSESPVLDHPVKKGDYVWVRVQVSESNSTSSSLSHCIFVGNAPPTIKVVKEATENGIYQATLDVRDPEGESVALSLKSGPSGMTVDSATGVIRWVIPPETRGVSRVEVSALDGLGAETLFTYSITISGQ